MSEQDTSLELEPVVEEAEGEETLALDEALNALAMNTLNFMNDEVSANKAIGPEDHAYVMLHATEAVMFNILMHIADNAGVDPIELATKTKDNLMEAINSMAAECCNGEHHHH